MILDEIKLTTLDGKETSFGSLSKKVTLVVNVASRCGLSPQYETLEAMQKEYGFWPIQLLGLTVRPKQGLS